MKCGVVLTLFSEIVYLVSDLTIFEKFMSDKQIRVKAETANLLKLIAVKATIAKGNPVAMNEVINAITNGLFDENGNFKANPDIEEIRARLG